MPGPFLWECFDAAAAVRKNNKPRTNRERKEAMQCVLISLGVCIKANTCKPPGLGKFFFVTIVFLSYCFHRPYLQTSFSHSCKYTSENIKNSGWEQKTISSHAQCRNNSRPIDSPKLAPGHQQMKMFCMILCSITNLGGLQELWKHYVSLLWSSSLPKSGWSQWLMLSSESPKGPSSLFCQKRPWHRTESGHHRWGNSEEPVGLVKR